MTLRIVLVGLSESDWRVFRQQQWMAAVRSNPALSSKPCLYYDIDATAYVACRPYWGVSKTGGAEAAARGRLHELGAREIPPISPRVDPN